MIIAKIYSKEVLVNQISGIINSDILRGVMTICI